MADETDNETPEAQDGQAADAQGAGEQPEQAVESQAPDAQAEETADADVAPAQAADVPPEVPEADAAGEQPAGGEDADSAPAEGDAEQAGGPVDEAAAGGASGGEAPARETPAGETRSPKEVRRSKRSRHVGDARPPRSPQERHAERLATRAAKALRRRARRSQERAKATERRAATPAREPLAPVHPGREGARRERQGVVVSDRAEKTITVRIDIARRHRRYEKIVRSSNTLHAHDENNEAHIGDVVRVIESRPLSKTKRWRLVDVLERAR